MNDIDSDELSRQLAMVDGLNIELDETNSIQQNQAVETADTLLGNVPFGSITQQISQPSVGVPFTPENPLNTGIVSNVVTTQQANTQAAAQVVQPTTAIQQTMEPINTVQKSENPVMTQQVQVDMNAEPVFVNLGESVYETKTDFLKLKEGEATRVTLINYNAVSVHEHFKEGLGYFKCKSSYEPGQRWPSVRAICCQQPNKNDPSKLENAGYKVLLPVIEYPVNHNDGRTLIAGGVPKLKVLKLSQTEYNTLDAIRKEYGEDTSSFDISIVRQKGTTGYLQYILTAGKSWRAQFAQQVLEESNKLSNETYNMAIQESSKDISIEKLQEFFNEQRQQEQMAAQFANQPMIDPSSLGI